MKQNHNDSYVDYFKHERIFDLLKRKYFWNNMSKNIKKYVDIYSTCYRVKFVKHKSHDLLQSFFIFEKLKQDWTMNFITNLSFSKHKKIVYDSMLMMIDRYIKFNLYISSKKNMKFWKLNKHINRWNFYQIRKTHLHCDKSKFSFYFQVLIIALLSFMNTFTI